MSTRPPSPVSPGPVTEERAAEEGLPPAAAPVGSGWRPPRSSRTALIVIVGVAVAGVLAVLAAWRLPPFVSDYESTDNAFVDAHIVRLAPQIAGTLTQVADVDTRHVDAGRPLAVPTPSPPGTPPSHAHAHALPPGSEPNPARPGVPATGPACRRRAPPRPRGGQKASCLPQTKPMSRPETSRPLFPRSIAARPSWPLRDRKARTSRNSQPCADRHERQRVGELAFENPTFPRTAPRCCACPLYTSHARDELPRFGLV